MGEWLAPTDERWSKMLEEVAHDFYHLPAYAELCARSEGGGGGGRAMAYYAERARGRVLIPLVERRFGPVRDAASPYGYGGPILSGEADDDDMTEAFAGFIADGAARGLVSSFLRLHPLLHTQVARAAAGDPRATVVTRGPTVSVDLTQDSEELDREVRVNHRRNVFTLRRAGFVARFDEWDDYAAFQNAYDATMRRHNAGEQYRFATGYFDELRARLGSVLHLCSVVSDRGEFACGGLFTHVGHIVQYHLGATADRYLPLAPSKLMFYEVRHWARDRGAAVLHLGGGVGGRDDSLYLFKRGFGSGTHSFQTVNVVHDRSVYGELTRGRPVSTYFPQYRAPVTL